MRNMQQHGSSLLSSVACPLPLSKASRLLLLQPRPEARAKSAKLTRVGGEEIEDEWVEGAGQVLICIVQQWCER